MTTPALTGSPLAFPDHLRTHARRAVAAAPASPPTPTTHPGDSPREGTPVHWPHGTGAGPVVPWRPLGCRDVMEAARRVVAPDGPR